MPIVTQEELAQLVPRDPLGTLGIVPSPLQVANRLHGLVRHVHLGQIAGTEEVRQLSRVTAVGLHAVAWFARHQGRGDHEAIDPRLAQATAQAKTRGTGLVTDLQDLAVLEEHFQRFPQTHSVVGDRLPVPRRLPPFAGDGNHDRILVYIQTDVNYTRTHWTSPPVCGSVVKGVVTTTL
jgi:hypothetical protein